MANNIFNQMNQELKKKVNEEFDKLDEVGKNYYFKKRKKFIIILNTILALLTFSLSIMLLIFAFIYKTDFYILLIFSIICFSFFATIMIGAIIFINQPKEKFIKEEIKNRLRSEITKKYSNSFFSHNYVIPNFTTTKSINLLTGGFSSQVLLIDDESKQIILKKGSHYSLPIKFSEILNYEIYENDSSVVKGTAGKALVGGLFFGLGGMIVGSSMKRSIQDNCNSLKLIIRINDISQSQISINYFSNVNYSKNSYTYKAIKDNLIEVCSTLEYIMNKKDIKEYTNYYENNITLKQQIKELKEMLDEGLIGQDEYEQKKKQILKL